MVAKVTANFNYIFIIKLIIAIIIMFVLCFSIKNIHFSTQANTNYSVIENTMQWSSDTSSWNTGW